MELKPTLDRVVIETIEKENKTEGGLYIPDSSISMSNQAKVIAVGPGRRNLDGGFAGMEIKAGDTIALRENLQPARVNVDGKEYQVVTESDILGVLQ